MLNIEKELVEKMVTESKEDPAYFFNIVERMPQDIKDTVLQLMWDFFSLMQAAGIFYFAIYNGLDKFEIPVIDPFKPVIPDEICQFAGYIEQCETGHKDKLLCLTTLYRIFEMELESR